MIQATRPTTSAISADAPMMVRVRCDSDGDVGELALLDAGAPAVASVGFGVAFGSAAADPAGGAGIVGVAVADIGFVGVGDAGFGDGDVVDGDAGDGDAGDGDVVDGAAGVAVGPASTSDTITWFGTTSFIVCCDR